MNNQDPVQLLVASVRRKEVSIEELIDAYESATTSAGLETVGDSLNRLESDDMEAEFRARWHDVKVNAISGADPQRKRTAIRHLTAADYGDESVRAALLESLLREDETTALAFALSAGWNIDPEASPEVVELLVSALDDCERRRSSRAAYFATTLHALYENSTVVPGDALLRRLAAIVTMAEDPAAWAGVTDLVALAMHRGSTNLLREWLTGSDLSLIVLAVSAIASTTSPALDEELVSSLQRARATLSRSPRPDSLPVQVVDWAVSKIDTTIGA